MAQVLKYKHMTAPGVIFKDIDFTGYIEQEFDDHKKTVMFGLMHFGEVGEVGECMLYIENVKVAEFADVVLTDVGNGRYDLELENGYLLFHLIPEE